MRPLVFKVEGRVAGQGSKNKGKGRQIYESSKHLEPWRRKVTQAAERALKGNGSFDRHAQAVQVEVVFAHERPKAHFRTGKFATLLRDDAPLYYPHTPDVDKACRAVLDALTQAGAIVDDRRVVKLKATQVYVDRSTSPVPGAAIVVTPLAVKGEGGEL